VAPEYGRTLNAVTFRLVLAHYLGSQQVSQAAIMLVTLGTAAGLLFVASNTGFLGARRRWQYGHRSLDAPPIRHLSNRLVTQNGVLLMAVSAIAILVVTSAGSTAGVLYSINVFISFVLSFVG